MNERMSIVADTVVLEESPIKASWIVSGSPRTRMRMLSVSEDKVSSAFAWDCTAGVFDWYYYADETIHVIQGEATLTLDGTHRTITAGDLVYIAGGTIVRWEVADYIRKVAFLRQQMPQPAALALRLFNRARYRKYLP